jgi:tellurite resistance protein TehA-like permease
MAEQAKGPVSRAEAMGADQVQQRRTKVVAIVVAVVVVVALGFGGYELFVHPDVAEVLRDMFIILMAVESLAIGILLIVLIVQIINLTKLLQEEVLPILNSTNETVDTVKQTTSFVSDVVVSPLVGAVSTISAVQGGLKAIFRRRGPHSDSGHETNLRKESGNGKQQ